ncbi:Uncharacterized protein SCF082_LOCUS44323 [Durusdinium trenchii]|uniref:YgjP-like metallopeptidase domain-containing protein n=1 Tax=Durusdinium trenchii TaxID=1381693 RepID=A0ABP0R1X2_9DINO
MMTVIAVAAVALWHMAGKLLHRVLKCCIRYAKDKESQCDLFSTSGLIAEVKRLRQQIEELEREKSGLTAEKMALEKDLTWSMNQTKLEETAHTRLRHRLRQYEDITSTSASSAAAERGLELHKELSYDNHGSEARANRPTETETRYLVTIRLRLRLHPTKGDPQSDFLSHGTQIAVLLHELCHLKHMNHGKDFMLFLRDIFAFAQKLGVFEAGESNEIPSPWPWENVIFQRAGNVSDDELLQLFAEHREKQRQAKTPEEALKAAEVEAAELEAVGWGLLRAALGRWAHGIVTYFLRFLAVSDVSALEAYFDGLHRGDVERMKEVWHPEARLYWADAAREGGVADRSAEQFFEYMRSSTNSEDLSAYDQILSLDFASSRCCAAQVQLALKQSDPASGALLFTDFLVLLRLNKKWQIISKVFSSVPLSEQSYQEPYDALAYAVSDPVRGILSYMRGVHQSSPSLVSESFHGAARLCFSDQQEELVRWSRAEFFEVLQARAKSLDDPQALRFDKILSVRKAGPDVALIKLQVGLPPVLYTDFLSMLRLNGRWWIIAKSSDGEPF